MSSWITDSVDLIGVFGSFLTSEPMIYITGMLLLFTTCFLFKSIVG